MSMSQKGVDRSAVPANGMSELRLSRGRIGCTLTPTVHHRPFKSQFGLHLDTKYTLNIPDLDNKMLAIFLSMKFHIFRISPFLDFHTNVLYGRGTPEAPLLPWWRLRAGPSTSNRHSTVAHPSAMSRCFGKVGQVAGHIFLGFKWLAICLKIKIPKKTMKKTDKKPWCVTCLPAIALIIINYPFYIIRM